ncbi:DUF4037 domain-containing protein [Paracoccus liaowanqingii]|uniref:DUF4037 domain-containing protein n=1 Tax=Paracoccus liaowanqingii TaxID=2560053 RepID=A0A4Z1CQF8_9RHOB|nr:DUF4037 domain-containing protein [Paracoccus liaowanqingii]TGN67188.1 DUF4037 domain-containing protein [Paracoccus liaowanqingii]
MKDSQALASVLAAQFSSFNCVRAVTVGGSLTSCLDDKYSDLDIYVYSDDDIAINARQEFIKLRSDRSEINNMSWETGDEWIESATGIRVDVMYRRPQWIEQSLLDLLKYHRANIGYSTCLWHNVLNSLPVFDRSGWFAEMQNNSRQPYSKSLRAAIVLKNFPLLSDRLSSFENQAYYSALRDDRIAVNHRVAGYVASFFDVLFAINYQAHPGEKRMAEHAKILPRQPDDWVNMMSDMIKLVPTGEGAELSKGMRGLTNGLRRVL